ncbi:MAG: hypothetical protein AAGD86_03085 [Pseudomonadota bacterium]
MSDETPYTCKAADGRFEVRSASGICVVVCNDRHNAEHYATLLNAAWQAGYKRGYRDASTDG